MKRNRLCYFRTFFLSRSIWSKIEATINALVVQRNISWSFFFGGIDFTEFLSLTHNRSSIVNDIMYVDNWCFLVVVRVLHNIQNPLRLSSLFSCLSRQTAICEPSAHTKRTNPGRRDLSVHILNCTDLFLVALDWSSRLVLAIEHPQQKHCLCEWSYYTTV